MKWFKWMSATVLIAVSIALFIVIALLYASLPKLDDDIQTPYINTPTNLQRDIKGMVVINAQNQYDASYALGFAHAQDRLFQMDLLRRQAAGELSELVGDRALEVDKKYRIHQFRARAETIYFQLSKHEKMLLDSYSNGVNEAARMFRAKPPEYYMLSKEFDDWSPVDSLLSIFSMYIDLQSNQIEIDFAFEALKTLYGEQMHDFFNLPSMYQSSIDKSVIPQIDKVDIPNPTLIKESFTLKTRHLPNHLLKQQPSLTELPDIGSNNWAVTGTLTNGQSAMLSNDMHLGLAVPSIWYKAQLNYIQQGSNIQVTGVSLPGTPAIIVGSTNNIAWGFTNSGIDSVDWIKLDPKTPTYQVDEVIKLKHSEHIFSFEMSQYGPVREMFGQKYALKWVAHEPYAINLQVTHLAEAKTVEHGMQIAKNVRIPAQNLVLADAFGSIGWQLTGAITARTNPKQYAVDEHQVSDLWQQAESEPASLKNPTYHRLWTANARVVNAKVDKRYGNGGYALGARQQQIQHRLFEKQNFTENDFYDIQLDNEAKFLKPWHKLLVNTLNKRPNDFDIDIFYLINWKGCACQDSVGYTLVRKFRSALITNLLTQITEVLQQHDIASRYLLRNFETSVWQIITQKDKRWLPSDIDNYDELVIKSYEKALQELSGQADDTVTKADLDFEEFSWGKVNRMKVTHPFANSLGPLETLLNMPEVDGFGDSFMPAVQRSSFGASQRFIVRPGNLDEAILTIPGGQSGHFLSKYYDSYFKDYSHNAKTPLLPLEIEHTISFVQAN